MVDTAKPLCTVITGIEALSYRYDVFIFDQWGVLHNGAIAFPGAISCLAQLMALGKTVFILSNSGKRAEPNEKRLASLGFPRDSYTTLITSGETFWLGFQEPESVLFRAAGTPCLHISNDNDHFVVQGLSLRLVDDPAEAAFVLLSGAGESDDFVRAQGLLDRALQLRLPLVCVNPDVTRIVTRGLAPSAGLLAQQYASRGGQVHYIGKPYPDVFNLCKRRLSWEETDRVVMVGDSLEHDIDGGANAGFDTAFVRAGIHAQDFINDKEDLQIRSTVDRLVQAGKHQTPNWTFHSLCW
jgi:HAD superfamily hydrolase (TIGR01459 family)